MSYDDSTAMPAATRARRDAPLRLGDFEYPSFPFRPAPEQGGEPDLRHPVAIVGGGMVGLTLGVDLARKGIRCVLLDDNNTVSAGSRAIAQNRRTMDVWARMGCAEPMRRKGTAWSRGHTHMRDDEVLSFQVFPEENSRFPSFTNLAQYYVEHFLIQRAAELPELDLRWLHRVAGVRNDVDGVFLDVETPDGSYTLAADWLVAADGGKSTVRNKLGIAFPGDRLRDKFVIADVRLGADFPHERNFWFQPPFYDGNTVLRVPQADSVWRIDWQIDSDADVEKELSPANVRERLRRMLPGVDDFEVQWASTYTSEHRLLDSFRHGRVLFAGDAAHQFSPFGGGRGGNSGIQDADNLAWKLAAVVRGQAGERLLDSYDAERRPIALRNLKDSRKSTEFITPKSEHSRALRDAVLRLAKHAGFAKAFVNTGRFAVWPVLEGSPLSGADDDTLPAVTRPGTPLIECELQDADGAPAWLSDQVGDAFVAVRYGGAADALPDATALTAALHPVRLIRILPRGHAPIPGHFLDARGLFAGSYGDDPGITTLFRPDQHILARWRDPNAEMIAAAVSHALGGGAAC